MIHFASQALTVTGGVIEQAIEDRWPGRKEVFQGPNFVDDKE